MAPLENLNYEKLESKQDLDQNLKNLIAEINEFRLHSPEGNDVGPDVILDNKLNGSLESALKQNPDVLYVLVDEIDRLLSVVDDEDLKNLEHLLLNIKIDNSNESNFWNLSWNEIIESSTGTIRNNISSLGNFGSGSFVLNDGVVLGKETVHGYNLENNTLTDSKERNIMTFGGRRFYDFSRDYSNRRNMDNACSGYRITKGDDDENNGSFYIGQFLNGEESGMGIRLDSDGRLYKGNFSSGFIKDGESTIKDNNGNVFDYKRSNGETKSGELTTKNGEKYEIDMGKDAGYDFRNNWLVPIKSDDPSENDQGVKVQKYYNCNSGRVETITQIS